MTPRETSASPASLVLSGRPVSFVGEPAVIGWLRDRLGLGDVAEPERSADAIPIRVIRDGDLGLNHADGAVSFPTSGFPTLVILPPAGIAGTADPIRWAVDGVDTVHESDSPEILRYRLERLIFLEEQRGRTIQLLENLSDAVITRTLDGTILSINAAGERLLGLPRDELIGRKAQSLPAPLSIPQEAIDSVNEHVLAEGRHRQREELFDKAGNPIIVTVDAVLVRDQRSEPYAVQLIVTDITRAELASRKLRQESERNEILASIILAARDSFDLDSVAEAALSLVGRRLGARTTEIWLFEQERQLFRLSYHWRVQPEIPSLVGFERTLADSDAFRHLSMNPEGRYYVPDSRDLDPESVAARVLNKISARAVVGTGIWHRNELIGILGISFSSRHEADSTEFVFLRRVADQMALAIRAARLYTNLQERVQALAEAQKSRDEADRDRQRLTAMLVHDLKNPLAAILASLEILHDKLGKDEEARETRMLRNAINSSRALQGLVDDALYAYRPAGTLRSQKRPANVTEALAQPLEEALWIAGIRRIKLSAVLPSDLPFVPLDVARFRRAVSNLVGNALKFTPASGHVEVSAALSERDGENYVVIEVKDSGPGLPEDAHRKLGTPFLRFSGSEGIPGTGLGLSVVTRVASDHQGWLEASNRSEGGACFSLWLPLERS